MPQSPLPTTSSPMRFSRLGGEPKRSRRTAGSLALPGRFGGVARFQVAQVRRVAA